MEEIRNWWEVPSIAHFCSLFRAAFGLTDFEIEDLEDALLIDGSSEEGNNRFLADLHARLLRGLYGIKEITAENFEPYLSQVLKIRWVDELGKKNPLADREYSKLTTREKVEVLHDLCDFRLDVEDVPELLKGLDADSLRVEPLGFDAEGSTYWYFYGTRLYQEEKPPEKGEKPKKKSKKKKKIEAKNKKKKGKLKKKKKSKVSSSDSEPETDSSPSSEPHSSEEDNADNDYDNDDEHDSEEKEEQEKKCRPPWSVVCSTEEEWQQLAESFKKTKNRDEKLLYETLSVDFVPEIGKMIEAKDKAMRKKLLMELAPRRASDRIASKAQVKEEEEQMEENEKQREKERLAEERRREEEERQREKQQQAERRQQERARRARMREERQWLMANGEFVPEELRLSTGQEEERAEQVAENKVATDSSSSIQHGADDDDLEDRDEDLYTGMYKVMDALKKHNNAWPFLEPVEESYAPQYYEIIEQPMDLSTIEQKLDDSKYKNLNEFVADMKLMFENCLEYNGQDSMYTKMANSLEAAFNRHLKKHFPEDDDNSDEDFEEELARKSKKDKKRRSESHSTPDMFRGVQTPDEHHFAPQLTPSGMQSMFSNHMMPNTMTNGGMMPSHHPSRMPFPGPPHFAPDGRPLYPPQFYQNTFNPTAFARFGMAQAAAPQYNRVTYPQGNPMSQMGQPPQPSPFPPQGMPGRLPFQFGMPSGSGHSLRENDMNGPNQTEQPKQLSPQQLGPVSTSGEPTPSAVTGGMERGRQLQQPHRPPYYRPQSFNQAFPGYPRSSGMPPYGAPGTASYGQPMIPGREPWRIDRRTPEAAPQRVPLANGPFREEGQPSNPPEPTKDRAHNYNFSGSQPKTDSSSDSDERDSGPEHQQELRDSLNKEPCDKSPHQPRNKVPATLSISHILSGASREGQQQGAGARLQQTPGQVTGKVASSSPPVLDKRAPHVSNNIEGAKPPNNSYDAFSGKGPYDGAPGRESFGGMYGREHYRNVQKEGLEWKGPSQDGLHRKEPFENAFSMKFNDRKFPSDAIESVIKKSAHENVPEPNSSKKMPELRPIKDTYEITQRSEEKKSEERTHDIAPANGHLESSKTDSAGHRISADMYKQMSAGARTAPYKNWPGIHEGSSPLATGSFLQELNDAGPPSATITEKPVASENHRLPFTSLLKGIVPSQSNPVESRGGYVNLEATNRDRMRENMMAAGGYMRAANEKFDRFNPARPGDVSPYAMYANKRPSEMMPPLQYRPNMSALAQQRNLEGAGMSASDPQFVDLNSMQFRHAPRYPSRDSLTREQMYFLEQQRRQQMTSSMGAMMAGGQPDRILGFSGMLRQQQLFDAAYASHMRNGEYPGYPNEEVPAKMGRFS